MSKALPISAKHYTSLCFALNKSIIIILLWPFLFIYADESANMHNSATDCKEEFHSGLSKNGTFTSPRYPTPYTAATTCRYTFEGIGKERVQIIFTELDLHYPEGNPEDPFDCEDVDSVTVSIFIGGESKEIGVYCGTKIPPMLMSNENRMDVTLTSRSSQSTSKGFKAMYRFVTDFGIKAGSQGGELVCGFIFRSEVASNGTFQSPNFPGLYPRSTECHYLFYGVMGEKIYITFPFFDVEGIEPSCTEETSSDYVEFSNFNIRLKDRKMSRICGSRRNGEMKTVQSDGNFFRVTFKSNDVYDATGFEAYYQFHKMEYFGIKTGKQDPQVVCGFLFKSEEAPNGTFTSPNFPGLYPRNTECHYLFYGNDNERVHITFPYFDVEGIQPSCVEDTMSDYVEFSNFNIKLKDRKMSRFCGSRQDGQMKSVDSDGNFFRVTFKSNDVYDATGFEAFYQFRKSPDPFPPHKRVKSAAPCWRICSSFQMALLVFISCLSSLMS